MFAINSSSSRRRNSLPTSQKRRFVRKLIGDYQHNKHKQGDQKPHLLFVNVSTSMETKMLASFHTIIFNSSSVETKKNDVGGKFAPIL
jgi:hypothetical protein